MADDFASAMVAFRRDYLDGALEAIEDMRLALRRDLKGFVVIVSAQFAFSHNLISPGKARLRSVFCSYRRRMAFLSFAQLSRALEMAPKFSRGYGD